MKADQLLAFEPRGANSDEMTIFDQFAANVRSDDPRHREDMRLLGGRLARSFLCLLAPLIALAFVCLTNRLTNYFALPLACMGLMSLNVTSEWLIRIIVPLDPWGALRTPAMRHRRHGRAIACPNHPSPRAVWRNRNWLGHDHSAGRPTKAHRARASGWRRSGAIPATCWRAICATS
jgi:hypothetical protein